MKNEDKIKILKEFIESQIVNDRLYDALEQIEAIKYNYGDYMITAPINCDEELRRVPNADYDLVCAIITMLFREDHFSNGSLIERHRNGQVIPVLERLLVLLEQEH